MSTVNLAVVGPRHFVDYARLEELLLAHIAQLEADGIQVAKVITIRNVGANDLVKDFCTKHSKQIEILEIDWDRLGKSAAYQTNDSLVAKSTHLVCFWDRVEQVVGDAVDKGLRLRRAVKIFKVATAVVAEESK